MLEKNRNLHAISLLNMIINNKIEEPYNKFPPTDYIPSISQPLVNSKLTNKFWKIAKNIFETAFKEDSIESNNKKSKKIIFNKNINPIINIKKNNYQKKIINNNNINYKENKNNNINEEDEKRKYIEICKSLKLKNDKYDEIILKQEEENESLVKKVEDLESIINNK